MKARRCLGLIAVSPFVAVLALVAMDGTYCHAQKKSKKPVAGRADVLRHIPKKFAAFEHYDAKQNRLTLRIEGEKKSTEWKIAPGAEIKYHGWWGRFEQFRKGDRVWVWFTMDRKKKPRDILMLADEISEQDIHDLPVEIKSMDGDNGTITVGVEEKKPRTLTSLVSLKKSPLKKGDKIFVQSSGDAICFLIAEKQIKQTREKQKEYLREEWRKHGLPGMVSLLHPLGGEMEITLDHEAMRWGRYLKNGDNVTLGVDGAGQKIKADVRKVEPWRELTRVTLVTKSGVDQLDLTMGQRIHAFVPEPPKELQVSELPTDLGRKRSKEERVEWFLASVYCTCRVPGDRCTGMFYSLASCNRNACGNPNLIRRMVIQMIDENLNDREIFERLLKKRGPQLLLPHLLQ